jgi:alpha/beta superfamily hydrolase
MPSRDERDITLPESGSKAQLADFESPLAVIVTHPWGPLGGNMNNNVVLGIVFWFQRLKVTTLRFDFCGTQLGRGGRQVEQVKEAAEFLLRGRFNRRSTPPNRLLLVGYSYGSIISASASASIPQVIGVASIAPPLGVRHWLFLFNGNYHLEQARKRPDLPSLMVMGDKDNFTSESAFMEIVKTMPQESTTGAVLKDADHFFRGREKDLMDILGKQEGDRRWTEHASSMSRERMFLCARVVDQWK